MVVGRILITGAGGNLGRGVVECLQDRYALTLSDVTPFTTHHPFAAADARQLEDMRRIIRPGYDVLVHTPAWHGVHAGRHPTVDYWQLNVDGTFNTLQAAAETGITRVVWASSAVFYGPIRDKYAFSKQVGEAILDHFREAHGMQFIRLRYANFTPSRDFVDYGLRFLGGGGLDRRDAAGAAAQAVEGLLAGTVGDSWFDVTSDSPFTTEQAEHWPAAPWDVLADAFPADIGLLRQHLPEDLPPALGAQHPSKLRQELGYAPSYNFATFVRELRERDRSGDLSAPAGYSAYTG